LGRGSEEIAPCRLDERACLAPFVTTCTLLFRMDIAELDHIPQNHNRRRNKISRSFVNVRNRSEANLFIGPGGARAMTAAGVEPEQPLSTRLFPIASNLASPISTTTVPPPLRISPAASHSAVSNAADFDPAITRKAVGVIPMG